MYRAKVRTMARAAPHLWSYRRREALLYIVSMSLQGQPAPSPSPPTLPQAATIVMEASNDPGWGMFVWLAMTAGARPAELCVLRWDDVDFDTGELTIRSGAAQVDSRIWEEDTGTDRPRRIGLDAETTALLRTYLAHCAAQAAILGIERRPGAYVFSPSPDGGTASEPDTVSERYARTCAGLRLEMHLDQLPRYSATELVAAGVDVRAFSWRLQRGLSRIQRRPRA